MPAMHAYPQDARVQEFDLTAGQTFLEGAAVFLTGSPEKVSECGTDPATILGFALHAAAKTVIAGKVLVALAESASRFWMSTTSGLVATDQNVLYGIVKDSDGVWVVDRTETTNTRVEVLRVDLSRTMALVNVLAANRQYAS